MLPLAEMGEEGCSVASGTPDAGTVPEAPASDGVDGVAKQTAEWNAIADKQNRIRTNARRFTASSSATCPIHRGQS